ncbi:MAG: hypothetical protein N4J56_004141 [Chroococcidiopsis sp. SAG 2025]|uniref:DUF2808 domain-containing protein n=1 Tax=Chroococcidiopsis sp. SAG 2025 TaxID=171389 RepID=UPI002936E404|nr:DUF2808 domain-containing protein [Chroococcidiopsis sp. SAG 2025]MDV2994487.1 hypothetical protein [Chroococcidiopsis sp. SAG 2025]
MNKQISARNILTKRNLAIGAILSSSLISLPVMAVQLGNGQTAFNYPPHLVRATTSYKSPHMSATYYFTLAIPQNAGEPLGAVTISQRQNSDTISFDPSRSRAFLGDRFARGSEIPLASIGGEQPNKPGEATIAFDPPVPPGNTVTVALRAKRNPNGGIYLFGVTAFPAGEKSSGQFLGYGRLHFGSR